MLCNVIDSERQSKESSDTWLKTELVLVTIDTCSSPPKMHFDCSYTIPDTTTLVDIPIDENKLHTFPNIVIQK
jgi:hypothetical protein